ncbi:small glutamine-rich tetratricopeptide repeat-containing protein beta isoform X3 [Onychostruthus taczanowskii]|uniref:small glutamine-rich tetratricopeptide repeat-containing protein beta isoform X3 n=2 Tax=Onychostruthus taczanowskii TaxID=356909 RepID=UPI001B80D9A8|nr:small glutamine-rich tetratricopeptide repeat-containing protein beta isoform X3 [Onychostruthus taczanowskii]
MGGGAGGGGSGVGGGEKEEKKPEEERQAAEKRRRQERRKKKPTLLPRPLPRRPLTTLPPPAGAVFSPAPPRSCASASAASSRPRVPGVSQPEAARTRRISHDITENNFNMSSVKRLVYAVIRFLREQSQMDTFTPDEQESLEVAIQCLETVFKITLEDTHLASSQHLIEMFTNSIQKNDMLPLSRSLPEGVAKADQLKDEGNNHMKEENYGAAVDCYTRAIELDPNNAVYYCNRAAAQSKLNNFREAIKDCESAIAIDPKYSKAYGRMGLALTSVNKYEEAVTSYQKALDLDPENDSYKSNLKIAEQKLRDVSSPTGTGLSFDMASLINNPAFISMAASLMQNPQIQQLMSGMMSNAIGGPAAGVGGLSDLSSLIHAGQQFAQQIQQQNPELIEQLRNHIRSRYLSGSTEEHS